MKALKATGVALALALLATTAHAQAKADWPHFGGDIGDTKYSALDQINAGNIKRLKVVWRAPALDPVFRAENPALVLSNNFRNAPLSTASCMSATWPARSRPAIRATARSSGARPISLAIRR
jgi:hypothetical protein